MPSDPKPKPPEDAPIPTPPLRPDSGRKPKPPLSLVTRVLLLTVGWVLVGVGIAGLVLPGIQGVLTLVLGFAMLSVASQTVHRWLRGRFRRWPKGWRRMERLRKRVDRWLRPKE